MTARRTGSFGRRIPLAFADRFFFEIVERRGYKGFGAANAPFRIAAQAQQRFSSSNVW